MTGVAHGRGGCQGEAFLILANGVAAHRRRAYENWHSFEHVPERLTMPGFLAGRRYVAGRGAATRYLTVYDLAGVEAVETPAYRQLLAHPTPASLSMRPAMSAVVRGLYRADAQSGAGLARYLGWLTWRGGDQRALPDLPGRDGIVSVRLGTSCVTAPHPAFPPTPADAAEHRVALVGGTERRSLQRVLAGLIAEPSIGEGLIDRGLFDLILAY